MSNKDKEKKKYYYYFDNSHLESEYPFYEVPVKQCSYEEYLKALSESQFEIQQFNFVNLLTKTTQREFEIRDIISIIDKIVGNDFFGRMYFYTTEKLDKRFIYSENISSHLSEISDYHSGYIRDSYLKTKGTSIREYLVHLVREYNSDITKIKKELAVIENRKNKIYNFLTDEEKLLIEITT